MQGQTQGTETSLDLKTEQKRRSLQRTVIEIMVIVAAAFAIAMLVQAFIVKPFTVHQVSMQPTLLEGDRILLSRLTYHFRDPRAGDVVVFHSPQNAGEDLVKRIVAVAGDRVAIRDGDLYVNGTALAEPYLLNDDFGGTLQEREVPEGFVFVMGDNRDQSGDSRFFGPIDTDLIIGEAFCIYWPIGRWGGL
ncbi:MAG: signal peptidase I [Actinobacteria bacterium RBG_13_63_9]|nr:MAG: signal peptidase I [Actinobacteria bacterium RBG_13_63_9]